MWLQTQAKIFFADGIRKLLDISNICVENVMDNFKTHLFMYASCRARQSEEIPIFDFSSHNKRTFFKLACSIVIA